MAMNLKARLRLASSRPTNKMPELRPDLSYEAQDVLISITRTANSENAEAHAQAFIRQLQGVPIADAYMGLVVALSVTLQQAHRSFGTPHRVLNEVTAFAIANAIDEQEPLDETGQTN